MQSFVKFANQLRTPGCFHKSHFLRHCVIQRILLGVNGSSVFANYCAKHLTYRVRPLHRGADFVTSFNCNRFNDESLQISRVPNA